jgi:hypothetical protein
MSTARTDMPLVPREGLPAWVYLLGGFAVLVVVQGALRKWVLPGYSTPLYIAKDVVLLASLGLFLLRYGFPLTAPLRRSALPLLWGGLAFIVALQAFNLNVPSLAAGVFGVRNYLLYSVLLVMMPLALEHVQRPGRLIAIIALVGVVPVLALGFYQYTMPVDHWINQYVAVGSPVEAIQGDPRITGTFSYIQGMGTFIVFTLAFGAGVLVSGIRRGNQWYGALGLPVLALALVVAPMNGSRSVVFGFALALPFVLYSAFRRGRRMSLVVAVCGLVLVGGYVGTQTEWATQGWAAFQQRVETASDQGTRVESMLWDPITKVGPAGITGYGAGSTHPTASALSSEGRVRVPGVSYEEELGRVIMELGVIGGGFFLGLKLWLLWMTWRGMQRARSAWEDVICMTAFVVAFQHLIVEKIVFNHVGGAIYWLCMGAAAWVWSRQQVDTRDHPRPSELATASQA